MVTSLSERLFEGVPMDIPHSTHDFTCDHKLVSDKKSTRYIDLQHEVQVLQRNNANLLAELERVCEEAQRTTRAQHAFLATMPRILRMLLHAMTGYTERLFLLVEVRGELTPAQQADMERVTQDQQALFALISATLTFAKLDAGQMQYHLTSVPVNDVLRRVAPIIQPQLTAKGVHYTQEACDPSIAIWADGDKAQQIVLNLLSNAVKFTPEGGDVTVRCRVDDTRVHIIVSDTGVGIARNKLEQIFEPSLQTAGILSTMHEGFGLGLAISRGLARDMGGDIIAWSALGRGATFTLGLSKAQV